MSCTRAKECVAATSLQMYLQEIKDDALLSASEECELAEAIARGDSDARTRMIQSNLRLVVKIARDYVGRGIVLDDLIGEGNLGLIRAAEEFDPRFGTRFSTYASYWIKQAIRHALINTTSTIRLPAHMVCLLTKWRRAERSLSRESGRTPNFDEIASCLNLTEAQKTLVARAQQARHLRLEGGMFDDGTHWSPDESIDDHEAPDAMLESDDEHNILLRRLDRLDDRERVDLVAPIRPGRRAPADPQGDRTPPRRDPRMGPQDRGPRRAQARRPEPRPCRGASRTSRRAPSAKSASSAKPVASASKDQSSAKVGLRTRRNPNSSRAYATAAPGL